MAQSHLEKERKTMVWDWRIGVGAQRWELMGLKHMVTEMLEPMDSCQTLAEKRETLCRLV